jgi:hypothetical protein
MWGAADKSVAVERKQDTGLKKMYLLYILALWAPHTYDFVVLISLIHQRNILLVVLQIGKQEIGKEKDLSAPLRRNLQNRTLCVSAEETATTPSVKFSEQFTPSPRQSLTFR